MKQKSYLIIFLFFLNLLIKNISFELFYCGGHLPYQSLLISISTTLFLSSFLFITKNRVWTFCLSIFLDLWIIANIFYFRANNLLISVDAILMAGNLGSYMSSLKAYLCWEMLIPPATTILYAVANKYLSYEGHRRQFTPFILCLVLSIAFSIGGKYERWNTEMKSFKSHIDFYTSNGGSTTLFGQDHLYGKYGYKIFLPYSYAFQLAKWNAPISGYIYQSDITNFLPATIVYYFSKNDYSAETLDGKYVEPFINRDSKSGTSPKYNLLIILCESLESWLFEPVGSTMIMPHTQNFINKHNGLFFTKIKSQAMHGVSGDGQMTVCTGLLPIQNGAACISFATNKYPNFASLFQGSTVITPDCGWNQDNVSGSYGFKRYKFGKNGHWADDRIMIETTKTIKNIENPFCCLSVTYSMHTPFDHITNSNLQLPDNLPKYMNGYLNCANYTDSCLNILYSYLEESNLLDSTVVVITGDHTIFKSQMLDEFHDAAQTYNLSIADGNNYCPLIIFSPEFTNSRKIDDLCYQMDIFPTICQLIGYNDFYWKGFGVNLLDSTALKNRTVTEDEAYQLSDKIIRSKFDIKSYATTMHKLTADDIKYISEKLDSIRFEGYESHALGQIDGTNYTNCKEAFDASYLKGNTIFETDVQLIDDDEIVLMHTLNDFNALTNSNFTNLKLNDFKSQKILGKYSPADFDFVIEKLIEHNEIMFDLDIPYNWDRIFQIIDRKLSELGDTAKASLLKRIIFEVYSFEELEKIRKLYPNYNLLLCCSFLENENHNEYIHKLKEFSVDAVTMHISWITKDLVKLYKDNNIRVFVFTVDDIDTVNKLKAYGVSGVCTNELNDKY